MTLSYHHLLHHVTVNLHRFTKNHVEFIFIEGPSYDQENNPKI